MLSTSKTSSSFDEQTSGYQLSCYLTSLHFLYDILQTSLVGGGFVEGGVGVPFPPSMRVGVPLVGWTDQMGYGLPLIGLGKKKKKEGERGTAAAEGGIR